MAKVSSFIAAALYVYTARFEKMTQAIAPDLARIPGGEFLMGAADGEEDERPVHRVHVSEFLVGRAPVTQEEYARFVAATGHPAPAVRALPLIVVEGRDLEFRELAAPYAWSEARPPAGQGAHPVVLVTYEDAVAYCGWLSAEVGRPFRLPTEAEWEKAARGGLDGRRYPWGDEFESARCNYLADPASKRQRGTRPAGTFEPNGYGLFDVVGNTWEWVSDWYARDFYSLGDMQDPIGPDSGTFRIVRGGAWVNDDANMLRCAYRHRVPPDTYAYSVGFRVVTRP